MDEKKITKKSPATKSKAKNSEKKKGSGSENRERDSNGRFMPGKSGNPGGRPKLSAEFENYAKLAPAELWKIVQDGETSRTTRVDILKWFSEMYYGKARQQVDVDAEGKISGITEVKFEGVLDEWSV